ncbi:hypothetical protein ADL05_24805 [Nocardiopsis sp. NRRL B-16309]|nr:hypothetical protein ADL05_24805 [Nocardiopsis sp. NRRL B-16309]
MDEAEAQAELETIPGDGTFLVNEEVLPGTYRSEDVGSCYWARLSNAEGTLDSIIANDFGSGQQVVTIAASDYAFETSSCGSWNKV